jgi:hypothetical protein
MPPVSEKTVRFICFLCFVRPPCLSYSSVCLGQTQFRTRLRFRALRWNPLKIRFDQFWYRKGYTDQARNIRLTSSVRSCRKVQSIVFETESITNSILRYRSLQLKPHLGTGLTSPLVSPPSPTTSSIYDC